LDLLSFPSRRSSDLAKEPCAGLRVRAPTSPAIVKARIGAPLCRADGAGWEAPDDDRLFPLAQMDRPCGAGPRHPRRGLPDLLHRSEEHTSELQSREN